MSTTANPGRAVLPIGVPQAELPGAESLIDWPLPPFHEAVGETAPVFESAIVAFRDGRKVTGRLMRFSAATGTVEFCPERATSAQVLALSDIQELRLVRPVRLRPRKFALGGGAGEGGVPSGSLPFRIELVNGPPLEGETYGFQVHSIGLFLYIHVHQDTAIRAFYPATAIRYRQIGKRLGELLVDRQKLSSEQLTSALDQQSATRSQKIGEILTGANVIEQQELLDALRRQRGKPMLKLGEALIEQGTINEAQLQAALVRQKTERDKPLGELLVELGFLTRADLMRALTQKLGIPYVDLAKFPIDPQVLELVPRAAAIEYNMVPLCMDGRILVLAVENPLDPKPLERTRFLTSMKISAVMASGDDIRRAVARHFVDPVIDAPVENLAAELEDGNPDAGNEEDLSPEADSALVRLVNKMIADARTSGVSDVHIEANGGKSPVRIRFRQDGALSEYLTLPQHYRRSLVSRIKVMASLDISEKRRGQDGKIRFQQAGAAPLELRVATVPTIDGREDIVLRLLSSGAPIPLDKLGLRAELRDKLDYLVQKPHGIFIVCGPTGSGKTTTLHSILGHINTADLKIWAAEDPVEIQQEGLRQTQVNPKAGWTFAAAMRSFLRADPDVIMVGEMRDTETAQIAVEASLTGHTVFSTLHTNNAVDTVVRLLDMGVQPFNFADSLLGVLAQRLVRKLCPECKTTETLSEERASALATEYCMDMPLEPRAVLAEWKERYGPLQLWSAQSCEACRNTGYRGRIGVHELFVNTPAIAPLIHRRAEAHELRALAIPAGMRTLKQDGMDKCLQGLTDLKEVRGNCA